MLLNADSKNPVEEEDDIVLNNGDVSIGLNGTIPTVDFASHVIETLNKRMGLVVVVKLLGRKMGYCRLRNQLHNLWKPAGQIKLIDLDEDCFLVRFQDDLDYHNGLLLPKLPARYYHKSIIRSIGGVFGEVIRVDYNIDSGDRGDSSEVLLASVPNVPIPISQARETSEFGSWMQVQHRRRPAVRGDRPNKTSGFRKATGVSRYEVLREIVEDEVPQALDSTVGEPYLKADGFIRRSKGNATKNSKKSSTGTKQKGTMPQEVNQDGIFQSKSYAAREATSSLDPNYNSAILIEDPRLPRRSKEAQRSAPGPNGHNSVKSKPTNGNDPLSKNRGLKLSTSVTIQKLGGKPTSITEGPSSNLLKEVAKDLQMNHNAPDGASAKKFPSIFRSYVANYKPDIFVLVEPKISGVRADNVIKKLRFIHSHRVEASEFSGGIWILWSSKVSLNILLNQVQFVHMEEDLDQIATNLSSPWLLAGDFNAITNQDERRGGASRRAHGCPLFNSFINSNGLIDMGFNGPRFTWRRGYLFMRLDRAICSSSWIQSFPGSSLDHLPKLHSDHRPTHIKLGLNSQGQFFEPPFRFLAPWLTHSDIQNIVHRIWNSGSELLPCIDAFRNEMKIWNVETFGHIGRRKRKLFRRINGLQSKLEAPSVLPSDFLVDLEVSLREELEEVCFQEELLWLQKSSSEWICLGDRNNYYYHLKALMRKKRNHVSQLKNSEEATHTTATLHYLPSSLTFYLNPKHRGGLDSLTLDPPLLASPASPLSLEKLVLVV
ncbi:hypothetical protein K1719_024819 [Acacia pycnantha]|nr:hypothetical protein K1719_024819 [Acacia pycnantha]